MGIKTFVLPRKSAPAKLDPEKLTARASRGQKLIFQFSVCAAILPQIQSLTVQMIIETYS